MMPRTALLVVCGRGEVMATLSPTKEFTRVDLPVFGRPTTATKPDRNVDSPGAPIPIVPSLSPSGLSPSGLSSSGAKFRDPGLLGHSPAGLGHDLPDHNLLNPPPRNALGDELKRVVAYGLTRDGDSSGEPEHKAPDRIPLLVRQFDLEEFVHVVDRELRVDPDRILIDRFYERLL